MNMINIYNKLQNRKTSINAFLFVCFLFLPLIIRPLKVLTGWTWLIWPFTILFILISALINQAFKKPQYYLVFIILGGLIMLNIILVPYKHEAISVFLEVLKYSIVIIFLGIPEINYNKMSKYWYILGILTLLIFTFEIDATKNYEISYMFFGISIVHAYAGIGYRFIKKEKWYDFLLCIYSLILITLLAHRGAFLTAVCITLFLAFLLLKHKGKIVLSGIGVFSVVLYISGLLEALLKVFNNALLNMGVTSRTTTKIIMQMEQGLAAASSGRDQITLEAIEMIKHANFMPLGVGYYQSQTTWLYPHNILLEMMIIFGFLSVFIILGIVFANYRFYRHEKDPIKRNMVTLLLLISLTRLLLSDTFLTYTPFWMWMILILKDDLALWGHNLLNRYKKVFSRNF